MDLLQGLLLITSIHLLAAASPGPDFVLVSQQTLLNGKKSGFMVSIGIALGLSVHIIYSTLGLAAVIANSSAALWTTLFRYSRFTFKTQKQQRGWRYTTACREAFKPKVADKRLFM